MDLEQSAINPPTPGSVKRYLTLDTLRGVAALMVVMFHSGQRIGVWTPRFGYLAVDMFFLLSGFVLACAYDDRLQRGMATTEFMIARVVRLYPLYVIGLLLGACLAPLNSSLTNWTLQNAGFSFSLHLFGLPSPALMQVEGQDAIFALNPPFWSLFFEFWVANAAFALFHARLRGKALLCLILVFACALIVCEKQFYGLIGGWTWSSIVVGFARVGFSFFCGVAIARYIRGIPKPRAPAWALALALPLLLSIPLDGRIAHLYELFCVLVAFPALICLGSTAIERKPSLGTALGEASYAIYAIHYPLLVVASWIAVKLALQPSLPLQLAFAVALIAPGWALNRADALVRNSILNATRPNILSAAAAADGPHATAQASNRC